VLEYLPPHSALPSGFRRGAGRDDTQGKTHTGNEKAAEKSCLGKRQLEACEIVLAITNLAWPWGLDQVFTPLSAFFGG